MVCLTKHHRKSRYFKEQESINRRRRNKWLYLNKREKDFIEQQKFKVGHRGFMPQDLEVDFDIPAFTSTLEQIANQNLDIFIDTNHVGFNHIFNIYYNAIPYFFLDRGFRSSYEKLYNAMQSLMHFHSNFFSYPNINVITEVREELERYIKKTKKRIRKLSTKLLKKKLKAPLETLRMLLDKNNRRVIESGIEDDPVVERTYNLIPQHGYNGSSIPSETDRKLIAIPFAASLLDGKPRLILSRDRDVTEELQRLSNILRKDPTRLNLEDLGDHFKPARLQVKSIVGYNSNLRVKNKARLYASIQ